VLDRDAFVHADRVAQHAAQLRRLGLLVADRAGDVASTMAIDAIRTCLEAAAPELTRFQIGPRSRARARIRALLERAVRLCNEAVVERGTREPDKHGMGTTLEVVVLLHGEAFVAHVGDSRTYLIRGGRCSQLTIDHTVAEVMRRAGTIGDEEAQTSQLRSVLCNAIGVNEGVSVEHAHLVLEPGDRLLMCSDGLHDYFTPEELAACAGGIELPLALEELIEQARARGGHDNITGVVIEAGTTSPFDSIGEDTLTGIVEQALREDTQPIRG